jgi:hypothetical protein
MKKLLVSLLTAGTLTLPAQAAYYVAGDFNGWNAAGNLMTDMGGGLWQVTLNGVGGRHEFKITIGDWTQNWPGSGNSWFLGDGLGNITLTFNANDIQDGWRGNWGRLGTSTDPGTWTAVGDWQGWNNAGNAMTALGGGIYQYAQALAPGWYQWKPVVTGSWDAIGDDFRGANANTTWFEATPDNPIAVFEVNALAGIERVYVIPEPSILALLGVGLAGLFCLRRKQ